MTRLLAFVCRICPFCIARRWRPETTYARIMRKVEAWCPFCRAYDRLEEQSKSAES